MRKKARNSLLLIASLILIAGILYMAFSAGSKEAAVTETSAAAAPGEVNDTALPRESETKLYALITMWRKSSYYELSADRELRVEDGLGGYNIIRIKNGAVEVTEANCPDQICVYSLPLSEAGYGGLIACMPHALYITVVTEDEVPEDLR